MIETQDIEGLVKELDKKLELSPSRLTARFSKDGSECNISYIRTETDLNGTELVRLLEPTSAHKVVAKIFIINDANPKDNLARQYPNIRNYLHSNVSQMSNGTDYFQMIPAKF